MGKIARSGSATAVRWRPYIGQRTGVYRWDLEQVAELLEIRVLLQLHLKDAEQQQFDDVLHALNRRSRRTKFLVELLQDVIRVAVRVMYR